MCRQGSLGEACNRVLDRVQWQSAYSSQLFLPKPRHCVELNLSPIPICMEKGECVGALLGEGRMKTDWPQVSREAAWVKRVTGSPVHAGLGRDQMGKGRLKT